MTNNNILATIKVSDNEFYSLRTLLNIPKKQLIIGPRCKSFVFDNKIKFMTDDMNTIALRLSPKIKIGCSAEEFRALELVLKITPDFEWTTYAADPTLPCRHYTIKLNADIKFGIFGAAANLYYHNKERDINNLHNHTNSI